MYIHFAKEPGAHFPFISIKEATEVLKRRGNNYWDPPGSQNLNEKGEGKHNLEVSYLSLLEYLPEFCLETRAKLFGMKKQSENSSPGFKARVCLVLHHFIPLLCVVTDSVLLSQNRSWCPVSDLGSCPPTVGTLFHRAGLSPLGPSNHPGTSAGLMSMTLLHHPTS